MILDIEFEETNDTIDVEFGKVYDISDGGYERGYAAGKEDGHAEGYTKGHTDGLAERKHETWVITLTDGTIIEKEVALL